MQLEDHILDASDSGEELPDIQDVLLSHNFRKRKDPSSDTHYSDSVIDAGIRDMSPSTLPSGSLAVKAPSASAPVPRFHGGKPSWESSPYEKARPSKRTKLSESPPISVASSPIQEVCDLIVDVSKSHLCRHQTTHRFLGPLCFFPILPNLQRTTLSRPRSANKTKTSWLIRAFSTSGTRLPTWDRRRHRQE